MPGVVLVGFSRKRTLHPKMPRFLSAVFLFVINAFMVISLIIFASGFFPYKSFQSGRASFSETDNFNATSSPFDKTIFMLVDALRRSQSSSTYDLSRLLTIAVILYTRPIQVLVLLKSTPISSSIGNPQLM